MTSHDFSIYTTETQPLKRCTKCQKEYPATTEYFHKHIRNKDKLAYRCKRCLSEDQKNSRASINANSRKRYSANPEAFREAKRQERKVRGEAINAKRRENYSNNIEAERQRQRDNYPKYRETSLAKRREKHRLQPELSSKRFRDWRIANPEKARQSYTNWANNNPDKVRLIHDRRRVRKLKCPHNYTVAHWRIALDYFHGCCAVCGRQIGDLFSQRKAAMDHWIPLAHPDCPGTIPTNIVPLCHGLGGCNNSKKDFNPLDWLVKRYGKRKANRIQKDIEKFFDYMNDMFTNDQLAG